MEKLGTLPRGKEDWIDRIYFQMDGNMLIDSWLKSTTMFWENSEPIRAHCVTVSLNVGEHIATVYIDPFDNNLVSYRWAFTITE